MQSIKLIIMLYAVIVMKKPKKSDRSQKILK